MKKYIFFVTLIFLVILSSPINASSEYVLRLHHPGTIDSSFHQTSEFLNQKLNELTDGAIRIAIYPQSQLGTDADVFEQMQKGSVDMAIIAPGHIGGFTDEINLVEVPFLIMNYSHWEKVINSPVMDKISDIVFDITGVKILDYIGGGVRKIVSRIPIREIDDFNGVLLRLHESKVVIDSWGVFGVTPTVIAYNEVYNALQLGVIDGLDNEPEWIEMMKFYEQAPYIINTDHAITFRAFCISGNTFEKLSNEHQEALTTAVKEACKYGRELGVKLNNDSAKNLEELGAEFISIDNKLMSEKTRDIRKKYAKQLGLEDLLLEVESMK